MEKNASVPKRRWATAKVEQIKGVHPACIDLARIVAGWRCAAECSDLERSLTADALADHPLRVVPAGSGVYWCVADFLLLRAASRLPRSARVPVCVVDLHGEEAIRACCLRWVKRVLLELPRDRGCHIVVATYRALRDDERSAIFSAIKGNRALARLLKRSYGTLFPAAAENDVSNADPATGEGNLDLGLENPK